MVESFQTLARIGYAFAQMAQALRGGKVIVAKEESEIPAMQRIYERGQANGVTCELIGQERLRETILRLRPKQSETGPDIPFPAP